MARNREVFTSHNRKKPSAAGGALVILLLSAMVAFVGAYAWQSFSGDQEKLEAKQSMQSMLEAGIGESSSSISEPASSEPASSTESEPESSSEPPEMTSVVVPKGERVSSSYFDDALFVGDSITSGILSYEIMRNTTVIAHTGINPDTIRTKEVYRNSQGELVTILDGMKEHPDAKKIYIMLGANGLAWIEQDLFIEYYEEFLRDVMDAFPDATIYVQSILPVTKAKSDGDERYANSKIDAYNADILALTEKLGLYYVNVAEAFKDENGALPDDASPSDGMHFTSKYYQKWFDYLKTHTVQK